MAVTWNPADAASNILLSNGNLTAAQNSNTTGTVRATQSKSVGQYYWEATINHNGSNSLLGVVGFADSGFSLTDLLTSSEISAGAAYAGANAELQGSSASFAAPNTVPTAWAINSVMMLAVDFNIGGVWFGQNGTWLGGGNPATGVAPQLTFTPGSFALFPAFSAGGPALSQITANFGDSAFAETVPTGFVGWSQTWIATIPVSSWIARLSEPVRQPSGFMAWLQRFFDGPPRIFVGQTITMTMTVREVDSDVAEFAIYAYTPRPLPPSLMGATVSVTQIPSIKGGNVSIEGA
jgi:hypothetical protein